MLSSCPLFFDLFSESVVNGESLLDICHYSAPRLTLTVDGLINFARNSNLRSSFSETRLLQKRKKLMPNLERWPHARGWRVCENFDALSCKYLQSSCVCVLRHNNFGEELHSIVWPPRLCNSSHHIIIFIIVLPREKGEQFCFNLHASFLMWDIANRVDIDTISLFATFCI